jgi:hypothetical protein
MAQTFEAFRIDHVYRAQNFEADALANEALDETARRSSPAVALKPESQEKAAVSAGNAPRKLRAQYRNGTLHPLEPLDLPENTEVEIVLRARSKR